MYNFKDQAQAEEFFIKATSSGADPIETIQFMKSKGLGATPPATPEQPKTLGGFAGNVVKSGLETAGSIGSALLNILNPDMEKNTVANVGRLGLGAIEKVIPGEQGHEKYADAVGTFYKNRYGSLKAIGDTLYNDPVGALVDASMVADLGGTALGKIGAISKTSKLADAGKVLKDVSSAIDPLKIATKTAAKYVNPKLEKASGAVNKGVGAIEEGAASNATKVTGAQVAKSISEHGVNPNDLFKKYIPVGATDDVILGPVSKKGWGGVVGKKMKEAEGVIQSTIKNAGDEVVATVYDFIKPLEEQKVSLGKTVGNGNKIAKLDELIAETKAKFSKGLTADDLLNLKREADSTFGKAVVEDTAGTIESQAQKMIGNQARSILKDRFKDIADSLDQQSDLYVLQPILNKARGTNIAGKLSLSGIDVTRPGTLIDPILKNPQVASNVSNAAGKLQKGIKAAEIPVVGLTNTSKGLITFEKALNDFENNNQDSGENVGNQDAGYNESNIELNSNSDHTNLSDSSLSQDNTNVNSQKTLNSFGATPEQIWEAYVKVAGTGNKRKAALLKEMFDQEIKYQSSKNPKLNSSAAKAFTDSQTAVSMAQQLEETISQYADKMGPVKGAASGMNPYDTDAQTFRSQMEAAAQVIGKSMEGGVLRQEDVVKYRKILPQITDTVAVARNKIKNIRALLEGQQKNQKKFYQNMQPDILTPDTSMPQGGGNGGLGKYPPKYLLR